LLDLELTDPKESAMRGKNEGWQRNRAEEPKRNVWESDTENVREYRGRESYEEQYRGGRGGLSDMHDRPRFPEEERARDEWATDRSDAEEFDRAAPDRGGYGGFDADAQDRGYREYRESNRDGRRYGGGMSLDQGRFVTRPQPYGGRRPRTDNWPKGYRRSDERIREEVCDRLCSRWDIEARGIEVSVANGEVTLAGDVPERRMKLRAESVADEVSGVSDVHNQIRVSSKSPPTSP
jgi:hypothetical protein